MTVVVLYARSDVVGVGVPQDGGGCGQFHSRPVIEGNPVKLFAIDCPPCEQYLRDRLGDQWTTDRWKIPLTPDEQEQVESLERQAQAMQQRESNIRAHALANELSANSNGANNDTVYLVRPTGEIGAPLGGDGVLNAPAEPAGSGNRNTTDSIIKSIELAEQDSSVDLNLLTVPQLKIRCREVGVSTIGNKGQLIERLTKATV